MRTATMCRPTSTWPRVEGLVLDTLLERIFGVPRAGVSAVDAPTRFYVLWRFYVPAGDIEAGEAIVLRLPAARGAGRPARPVERLWGAA